MALHYQQAKFERSYGTTEQLPAPQKPEVSFAGRSNVGKSSLLNKLFNRKSLAKVSGTPGKTSNINFFECDGVYFVDLPGYGYAKRSHAERQRWADMIWGYYEQNRSFNLVVVLVDIRLDMQDLDKQMVDFLQEKGYPFIIALTKADKMSRGKAANAAFKLAKQFGVDREQMIITSSKAGTGMDELKKRIEESVR